MHIWKTHNVNICILRINVYFLLTDEELEEKILPVRWKHDRVFQVRTGKFLNVCYFPMIAATKSKELHL